jgi:hypothetical protein
MMRTNSIVALGSLLCVDCDTLLDTISLAAIGTASGRRGDSEKNLSSWPGSYRLLAMRSVMTCRPAARHQRSRPEAFAKYNTRSANRSILYAAVTD